MVQEAIEWLNKTQEEYRLHHQQRRAAILHIMVVCLWLILAWLVVGGVLNRWLRLLWLLTIPLFLVRYWPRLVLPPRKYIGEDVLHQLTLPSLCREWRAHKGWLLTELNDISPTLDMDIFFRQGLVSHFTQQHIHAGLEGGIEGMKYRAYHVSLASKELRHIGKPHLVFYGLLLVADISHILTADALIYHRHYQLPADGDTPLTHLLEEYSPAFTGDEAFDHFFALYLKKPPEGLAVLASRLAPFLLANGQTLPGKAVRIGTYQGRLLAALPLGHEIFTYRNFKTANKNLHHDTKLYQHYVEYITNLLRSLTITPAISEMEKLQALSTHKMLELKLEEN